MQGMTKARQVLSKQAVVALCAVLMWMGCSTEVDLTAPYDSLPVVYGLLELDADTQWVKVNRTWLGEGNQLAAAQTPDSSEYPAGSVQGWIVELNPSSSGQIVGDEVPTGKEWMLQETVLDNKETSGIFFGPSQRVYYAVTPPGTSEALREDKLYRLELRLPDGKEVNATTTMVESSIGAIAYPPPGVPGFEMGLANLNSTGAASYSDFIFRWNSSPGASLYSASLVVNYKEIYYADDAWTVEDSAVDRSLSIGLGSRSLTSPDDVVSIEQTWNTETFFTELATRLEVNPRVRRELGYYDSEEEVSKSRAFDFVLQVANQDLAIYLDVNETTNSIVQDRPTWTNIQVTDAAGVSQGGVGLWGSRTTNSVRNIAYTKHTIQHLQEGDLTANLNFCSPNEASDYYCE